MKAALLSTITVWLIFLQCYNADADTLTQLSYGGDVMPAGSPPTSTETPSTTKTSFFGGIKNLFRKASTTETPISSTPSSIQPTTGKSSTTNPQFTPVSPNSAGTGLSQQTGQPQNPTGQRDFVNPNTRPSSAPQTPVQTGQRDFVNTNVNSNNRPSSAPQTPVQTGQRDFVNTNVNPNNRPSSAPLTPVQSGQRDFVNPNIRSSTPAQNPSGGQGEYVSTLNFGSLNPSKSQTNGQNMDTDRRDYVGPVRPQSPTPDPRQSTPSTGFSQNQPTSASTPSGRRDYVNPNVGPVRPQSPTQDPRQSTPSTGFSQSQPISTSTSSGRRDYVNPNVGPVKPAGPGSPTNNQPQPQSGKRDHLNPNNEEFPALPPPRQPSRPGSPTPPSTGSRTQRPTVRTTPRQGNQGAKGSANELATDAEITTLTEDLFTKESNNPNRYITINYQGRTRSSDTTDEAPSPLLQVDETAFNSPTIEKLRPLFNNYELDTSVNEYVTPLERQEENEFIDAVMATSVMRSAMLFLQNKGIVTPDPRTHRELLKTIWFTLYSRGGGRIGSSAFEHIFASELKNGDVTGLHNWVYYYEEEKKGNIDYKGYIKKLDLGNKGAVVKFRFNFNRVTKPVNAMFVGTSPELELALYTVCFKLRADRDCPISLGGSQFNLRSYTFRYRGKDLIGSAFPEI